MKQRQSICSKSHFVWHRCRLYILIIVCLTQLYYTNYIHTVEAPENGDDADIKMQTQPDNMASNIDRPLRLVPGQHLMPPPLHHVNRKQLDSVQEFDIEGGPIYTRNLEQFDNHNDDSFEAQPIIRHKRAADNRPKTRIALARPPPRKTTSTSTTTTTTTTTTGPETPAKSETMDQDNEYEETVNDDYVDISKKSKPTDEGTKKSSIMKSNNKAAKATASKPAAEDAEETRLGAQEGEPEAEEENSDEADDAEAEAMTTTTTTKRPPAKTRSKGGKSRGSSGRAVNSESSKSSTSAPASTKTKLEESSKNDDLEGTGGKNGTNPNDEDTVVQRIHIKKKPLVRLPFIRPKNDSSCTREAYLEFPNDIIGNKWRARGLVLIHIAVVCYMFYSLALVCERYFMPSLEEFAQRLNLSEDVAGATLMSAGSSAPELFTAILGVFVAKGDVGTGTIVGSAVFNILFVIGICAFVSTTSAQLQWWPVLRDSVYYAFSVLVLIIIIYDERITGVESFVMLALYGVYILIMVNNEMLKEQVTNILMTNSFTAKLISSANPITVDGPDDVYGRSTSSGLIQTQKPGKNQVFNQNHHETTSFNRAIKTTNVEDDSMYLAALLVIVKHKRLFKSSLRFQSAARYIIIKRQHRNQQLEQCYQQHQGQEEQLNEKQRLTGNQNDALKTSEKVMVSNACGYNTASSQQTRIEAYAKSASLSKQKFSIVSKDDYEFWNRPPEEGENYYLWLAKIPVNYVLHYTVPDCSLYPDKYLITFFVSIVWTAFFSYIMVWMVTLIGFTFGIPDSVMGATFLAAGTSVPDCYSSVHAARNGMADMAVSNSIGSNVFDILIGLALPWFIQATIYPQVVATINSRGVIYSVVLLFISLILTIYLLNKYEWTLKPRLGLALLISYGLFIILTCMLEFNLFGHVNPPPC